MANLDWAEYLATGVPEDPTPVKRETRSWHV